MWQRRVLHLTQDRGPKSSGVWQPNFCAWGVITWTRPNLFITNSRPLLLWWQHLKLRCAANNTHTTHVYTLERDSQCTHYQGTQRCGLRGSSSSSLQRRQWRISRCNYNAGCFSMLMTCLYSGRRMFRNGERGRGFNQDTKMIKLIWILSPM